MICFEVGGVYTNTDYGFSGKTTHWTCIKRSAVFCTFECREHTETVKTKIRTVNPYSKKEMPGEYVYLGKERSLDACRRD